LRDTTIDTFDASVPWDDFGALRALVEAGFRLRRSIV